MKLSVPYLKLRDGRPRWEPGPGLRDAGFAGRDLKDDAGHWLSDADAFKAAARLNDEVAAWRRTGKRRRKPATPISNSRTLEHLLARWQATPEFRMLRPATRADYLQKARLAIAEIGPEIAVAAVGKAALKGWWRRAYDQRGHNMATGMLRVVSVMMTFAAGEEWIDVNPALQLKLPAPPERTAFWSPAKVSALVATADEIGLSSIGDAVVIGLHSAQRQADVLTMPPRIFDRGRIAITQWKRGALVDAPMTPACITRVADIRARWRQAGIASCETIIARERDGAPYADRYEFNKAFRKVRDEALRRYPQLAEAERMQPGLGELRYQDLRDTAVTRLAMAGCTLPQIAAITGHSAPHITGVIKHYLALTDTLADQGIGLLNDWSAKEGIAI